MSKTRINDLARELEVKSKAILDVLTEVGVTEKKTHSSSLEDHEAEKVRAHFRASAEASAPSRSPRAGRDADEIKTKIDLSHISKPGDVLKLITQKQQAPATPAASVAATPASPAVPVRPAAPPPAAVADVTAETSLTPVAPPAQPAPPMAAAPVRHVAPVAPPPRMIVPQTGPRPVYKAPPPKPVQPGTQAGAP